MEHYEVGTPDISMDGVNMDLYSSTDVTYFIEQGKYFEWSTIVYIYTASNPDQELALRGYVLGIDCVDDLFYMQGFSRGDKNGNWVADYSFNTEYSSTDTYGYETKGFETYFKMHFIPTSDVVLTPYGTSANDMNLDVTYICDGSVSDAYGCSLLPEYRDYKKGEVYNVNIDLVYVNVNGPGQYPVGSGIANYAPAGFYSDYFTMKGDEYFEGTLLDPLQVSEIHFKWAHRSHDNYTETKNYVSSNYYDEVTKCKYCNYEYWRYIRPAPPPTEECDHNWKYTSNQSYHWQKCTKCGDTRNIGSHGNYTCSYNSINDTCSMACGTCGRAKACECKDCDCKKGCDHEFEYTKISDTQHKGVCKKCKVEITENHKITTTVKNASCGNPGMEYDKCTICNTVIAKRKINALPHNLYWKYYNEDLEIQDCHNGCGYADLNITRPHQWGAWETIATLTCVSDGIYTRTCTNCGRKVSDKKTETATGHNYVEHTLPWQSVDKVYCPRFQHVKTCTKCESADPNYTVTYDPKRKHDWVGYMDEGGTGGSKCRYCGVRL